MPSPGLIYSLVMVGGTSSTDPDSIAPRWRADPYNTFVPEFLKAQNWADLNGQPLRMCAYQPCGYPRTGVMPLDAYTRMRAQDSFYCDEILRLIRDFAPRTDDFLIYTGSPTSKADSEWTGREIRDNIAPYAMQGMTSIAFDQSSRLDWDRWSFPLGKCDSAFRDVILEGQHPLDSPWQHFYPNIITADWNPANPGLYAPLQPGDYVLIGNVPDAMKDASRADKTAWKVAQCRKWLPLGVHCIIDADEIAGVAYADLIRE